MLALLLWIIAEWSERFLHENKAAAAAFFAGPPGVGGLSTGRVGAEKSAFLWFYRHHHHVCNLLFLM